VAPTTDVYASAILLYEVLAAERYWSGLSPNAQLVQLAVGEYEPPGMARLPTGLAALLRRALAPDAARRTQSCGELQAELRAFAEQAGWRASAKELRAALANLMPTEREELERRLERFREVGVEPTLISSGPRATHFATSGWEHDEERLAEPPRGGALVGAMETTKVVLHRPNERAIDTEEDHGLGLAAEPTVLLPASAPLSAAETATRHAASRLLADSCTDASRPRTSARDAEPSSLAQPGAPSSALGSVNDGADAQGRLAPRAPSRRPVGANARPALVAGAVLLGMLALAALLFATTRAPALAAAAVSERRATQRCRSTHRRS
jgi:hypothetical protein